MNFDPFTAATDRLLGERMSKHTPMRYSPAGNEINSWCHPEENGEYVKFSDYANLQRQNAELLEALETVAERFVPCKADYIFSKRIALDKVVAAIAKAKGEV